MFFPILGWIACGIAGYYIFRCGVLGHDGIRFLNNSKRLFLLVFLGLLGCCSLVAMGLVYLMFVTIEPINRLIAWGKRSDSRWL